MFAKQTHIWHFFSVAFLQSSGDLQ